MTHDVIVIGSGFAGLSAGLRLAQSGACVLILAKGVEGTHLDGGTIDVLGYIGARVDSPLLALGEFLRAQPRHPYALVQNYIAPACKWFARVMLDTGYPFAGNVNENVLLPSALGVARPTALVPQTMANGDLRAGGNFLIVGFSNLKDFYPDLCAANLAQSRIANLNSRSVTVTPPELSSADVAPLDCARAFERESFRAKLAEQLRPQIHAGEIVGLPALLGLNDAVAVWRDLEMRLNARVFEIPLLPPSIPGIRIFDRMTDALRKCGARIQMGFRVVGAQTNGKRVEAVMTAGANRAQTHHADQFILATGGIASGGIVVEPDGKVHESIFDLPLGGFTNERDTRFDENYFNSHPFNQVGVDVDAEMRPLDAHGEPVYENLRVAGGILAYAEPWKEKSGEGIALATAFAAVDAILKKD